MRTWIQNGLDLLVASGSPARPLIVAQDRSNQPGIKPAKPWTDVGPTLTGRQVLALVTHPALLTGSRLPARGLATAAECSFRQVSPSELSTIAEFPGSYLWAMSKRDNCLATGNAVSPRVGQHFLERCDAALP